MSVVEIECEIDSTREEFKRLTGNCIESKTVSMYNLKSYVLRKILMEMELKDLRDLALFLGIKRSGTKEKIVKRLWLSNKIERLGFITS